VPNWKLTVGGLFPVRQEPGELPAGLRMHGVSVVDGDVVVSDWDWERLMGSGSGTGGHFNTPSQH
jgi:hypothetical protein